MTVRHYGLLNDGRDKKPGSTERIDRRALVNLRDALGEKQAAAFLCEINEGDDNDEMAEAIDVFDGWTIYGRTTREPVFLSPDQPRAEARLTWVEGSAVQHWSPRRSVLEINLADTPETLLATHPAAGPHTPQPRPDWADPLLLTSWDNTVALHVKRKRQAHRRGRNVTWMADMNHHDLPALPGEITVVHHWTDYGRAYPAAGWEARFREGEAIKVGLDSHQIHIMHGTYHS